MAHQAQLETFFPSHGQRNHSRVRTTTSPKGFCHVMNFHDMSPNANVTMLNETFLVIKEYHETSPIIIISHQMS